MASDGPRKLFRKILVANRGEIACRVMRTAHRLGIRTVAVYSEPDARSPHVRMADEAVCVGPAASVSSYLRAGAILEAMRATGAEAVHPGYGFLSENAEFSEAVEAAGLAFIGPGAHAIRAMGDKIASKKLAEAAGVHTIPGFLGVLSGAEEAVKVANQVGYPVMLKASAGGGGKGMRIAWNDAETAAGYALSSREAAASFGDDRIFIERYVEQPRHIEIQLIADSFGDAIYLTERECSIQRRNQKVVEEAPAPNLSREAVKRMGEEAVALAKAVGYRSAGTVEFLVDKNEQHYFLEMNTRLQVEHPVTELVTGLDLVEVMIRVAAGERLPLTQAQVTRTGWAIESRVYAEDALRGFLPSTGTLSAYRPPLAEDVSASVAIDSGLSGSEYTPSIKDTVRVDDGVCEGGEISIHYDPMIAKLVTHGVDRDQARKLMMASLDHYVIRGVRHNVNFLRSIMSNPRFAQGTVTTNFIPEEFPDGYAGHVLSEGERQDLLACTSALQFAADARSASVGSNPPPTSQRYNVRLDESTQAEEIVSVTEAKDLSTFAKKTLFVQARGLDAEPDTCSWARTLHLSRSGLDPSSILSAAIQDGIVVGSTTAPAPRAMAVQVIAKKPLGWHVSAYGTTYSVLSCPPLFAEYSKHMKPPAKSLYDSALLSPMPGALLSIAVSVGDEVVQGQEVCVVEAMKMQNVLFAQRDGKVKSILAQPGSVLSADQPIIDFE